MNRRIRISLTLWMVSALLALSLDGRALHAQTAPAPAPDPQAAAHRAKGQELKAKQDFAGALAEYQLAYDLDKIEHLEDTTLDLNKIGSCCRSLGRYQKALDAYHLELTLERQINDQSGAATTLSNIGLANADLKQYDKALASFQQSLPILRQLGDTADEATVDQNIGAAYFSLGQYDKARSFYQQALPIHQQMGDKAAEDTTIDLNKIGRCDLQLKQYAQALDFFQQELTLEKQISDDAGAAATLSNIGLVYDDLDQYDPALQYYQQALPLYRHLDNKPRVASVLFNLGSVYEEDGQYIKAIASCQQALAMDRALSDKSGAADALGIIGVSYYKLSQYQKSLDVLRQALALQHQIGDKSGAATTVSFMADVADDLRHAGGTPGPPAQQAAQPIAPAPTPAPDTPTAPDTTVSATQLEPTSVPSSKPILRIETGMHTAIIRRISVDAANRYVATASEDKTVRVWDAKTGALLSTLRPPIGDGDQGKIYAVALSPDGDTVACGGSTSPPGQVENLYLFDRATGALRKRLTGLPNIINHLAYSPDGRFLIAALGTGGGIRLYSTGDYTLAAKDEDSGAGNNGASFGSDGDSLRLVTSCDDGFVRLFDVDQTTGALHLRTKRKAAGGGDPSGVAFSPDGSKIAVGFDDTFKVDVLSADDLSRLYEPDTTMVNNGDLSSVCWSFDGRVLYAGGQYESAGKNCIRRWAEGGRGSHTDIPVSRDLVSDLQARQAGGVFFAAGDPAWGAAEAQGRAATLSSPTIADLRYSGNSLPTFRIAPDAGAVQFEYQDFGKAPAVFSLTDHTLTLAGDASGMIAPVTAADGLDIRGWQGTTMPTLNGQALKLDDYETARSLAIAPDHESFLLGADWYLRLYGRDGTQKWKVAIPGTAWAVNISSDGKLAVAGFADGTIRWYRMTDGQELLAFFPHADQKRWVLWTPSGYYDCSPGAEDLIGWHVNNGLDHAADFFPVSHFRDTYYRPDVVARILGTQDEAEALAQANDKAGRLAQATDIVKTLPPVVAITSPGNDAETTTETLSVQYTVRTPSGEPVTEVRALVDGRPAQTESLSVVSAEGVARTIRIPVPPRDCLVSVVAFNKSGASEPSSILVHWTGTVKATEPVTVSAPEFTIQPTLYVLAVGIAKYNDPRLQLTYPAKDAQDFLTAMRAQKGKLYRDVEIYHDQALIDGAATKEEIENGLEWLQRQTTSNDVAMIFLSGHGDNDANGKYFFVPFGFDRNAVKRTGLPWTDLVSTVQDIVGKVIVFNDSCHSGNVLGGGLKGLSDSTGAINELTSAENGAVVFAASTGSEFAREDPAWGNGAFTKAVVEGISGAADYGHTGRITVNMLSLYVAERVKKLTDGEQHPTEEKPPTVRDFPVALDAGD